jgi:signal transduction histidine kinase
MPSHDVTVLDISCHSLLLMILVSLTFFTFNFPVEQEIGIAKGLLILIPSAILLVLLWNGDLVHESHIHKNLFTPHFSSLYPLYLFWYLFLIILNSIWIIKKLKSSNDEQVRKQLLLYFFGLIITNISTFLFGLFLPWILGFYYLVEISPLAFLIGFIFFTSIAIAKYNMFPSAKQKVFSFSLNKKIFFSALVVVPIIILLVLIPLGRIIFGIHSHEEMIRFFIISLFVGVIVSLSMSMIVSRLIAHPITILKEKALEIGRGNFNVKVEYNSNDEIGELSLAFNTMAMSLNKSINERKKLEAEIIRAEKLAALGKMSAILAHEIKTPLTSIKMNIDLLSQTANLNPEDKESLEIIRKETNRLTQLVKDVLQFSRLSDLFISKINLRLIVEEVLQLVKSNCRNKEIDFENKVDDVELEVDRDKFKQVLLNLLHNSIDAIESQGKIEIYSVVNQSSVSIFIKDNGKGIEDSEKIFEPFYTTKAAGTGLGLSVSQKIIEQHNGKLKLVSSKQGETIFEIELPINNQPDSR